MTTKATNSVLNLVDPPIDELVLVTPLVTSSGGTGVNTIPVGSVVVGDGANPIQAVAPGVAGLPLVSNGAGVAPSFQPLADPGPIDLTADVTGVLPVVHGGTGVATIPAGGVVVGDGANPIQVAASSVVGDVLTCNGVGVAPTFQAIPTPAESFSRADCLFYFFSATELVLTAFNGNSIVINSQRETIPGIGVILSNSGLLSSTFYYVYVYMNGVTMTLEASTTVPTWDSNFIRIKTGDSTRSLVGACYTSGIGQFVFSSTQLFVISYYNRHQRVGKNVFSTDRTTASVVWVELNSEIRIEFISWTDEFVNYQVNGQSINTTTTNAVMTAIGIDDIVPEIEVGGSDTALANYSSSQSLSGSAGAPSPENDVHYATLLGVVGGGSGTWFGPQISVPGDAQKIVFSFNIFG